MFRDTLEIATEVLEQSKRKKIKLAFAESCTGGLLSACLTSIPGSSLVIDRGYVTYSNEAKIDMLGVNPDTITNFGAVSEPTAREMAEGALKKSNAQISTSITGIAGPTGGTFSKPVGLVHIAVATKKNTFHQQFDFGECGREACRKKAIESALQMIKMVLTSL